MNGRDTAKAVIAEIVRLAPARVHTGRQRLHKAFYFSHLYYSRHNEGLLTEWPIVRMPNGPEIGDFTTLVGELVNEKILAESTEWDGPYQTFMYRYIAKDESLVTELTMAAREAIANAANYIDGKTGEDLWLITHGQSNTWNDAVNGEKLAVTLDLLSEDEYRDHKATTTERT